MDNYEEQKDAYSKFYSNFEIIVNEDVAIEIYNEQILNSADENDWSGEDWEEYKDEKEWYDLNKEKLEFEAEEEAIEEIIRRVFEDAEINVNRLNGDDYLDFQDYIKEQYIFLDPDS